MTILFLANHFNTGGITSYLLSLTHGLIGKGHKVIVASSGGDCEEILESYGVKHFNLGFRTKSEADPKIYLNLGRVKDLIVKEQVDVIHAQTRVTQVMGYFLSKMTQKPLITTCHGFFKPRFFRRLFPCWGTAVIAISNPVNKHLVEDFDVEPQIIHTILNGIDSNRFVYVTPHLRQQQRKQWGIEAPLVVGIVARLSDVKGIDVLIRSMPKVIKQFPSLLLMIVGEGPEEERLRSLVKDLGIENNVRFEAVVNQTPHVLPIFDIFVMPSRQEGLGLSVMEAQLSGLPVIASKVGGLIDLIEEGKTGYFVPPGESDLLANKMIQVLGSLDQAQLVGKTAREYIQKNFSLEQMVRETQEVYEEHLSR